MPNNTLSKVWGADIKPKRAKDIIRPKKKKEPEAPTPVPVPSVIFDGGPAERNEKTKGDSK